MKGYLFVIAVSFSFVHQAQNSPIGNWMAYTGNYSLNSKFTVHNEFQHRAYNVGNDIEQLLIRNGLGYNLSQNNNTILVGHAYVVSHNYQPNSDEKVAVTENRIFQQFITKHSFNRINFSHRYRIEERFYTKHNHIRFRYALSFNIPINNTEMTKNTIYAASTKEIFINNPNPSFDRFRLYGALGYVVNNNLRLEMGTMTQFLSHNSRTQFQIALFNNLNFNKSTSKKSDQPSLVNGYNNTNFDFID